MVSTFASTCVKHFVEPGLLVEPNIGGVRAGLSTLLKVQKKLKAC